MSSDSDSEECVGPMPLEAVAPDAAPIEAAPPPAKKRKGCQNVFVV